MKRMMMAIVVGLVGLTAMAFSEVPKDSARALGATKGKSFETGLVFINGKFLSPPYLVERWGTGIRISGKPVTGQVVDWNEFLKTQSGVKETKTSAPAASVVAAVPETEDDSSLDDLFDDNPKPKKKGKKVKKPAAVPKATTSVTYSIDGEFVPNETTRRYVKNINSLRSRIDRSLREGSVVFFGDDYRRLTVIPRMADDLIAVLPEIMRDSSNAEDLSSRLHAAHIEYLSEKISAGLYRNRIDYRALQERRAQIKRDRELQKLLNGSGN